MFRLSTLIPEGSQPLTENDTAAELGMRVAFNWALVLRCVVWKIEREASSVGGCCACG